MTESEWIEFYYRGTPPIVRVGRLHPDLCRALRCSTDLIRIRHDYALKMVQKHRLDPRRLAMIDLCLEFGRAVADKKHHLSFFYYDEVVFGGWQQLSIKSANYGNELWVATLHAQRPREVAKISKRHRIIRPGIA